MKKCRPQVCPHAAFLQQLRTWYYTLNKDSTEGVTESVHNIEPLTDYTVDKSELDEDRRET